MIQDSGTLITIRVFVIAATAGRQPGRMEGLGMNEYKPGYCHRCGKDLQPNKSPGDKPTARIYCRDCQPEQTLTTGETRFCFGMKITGRPWPSGAITKRPRERMEGLELNKIQKRIVYNLLSERIAELKRSTTRDEDAYIEMIKFLAVIEKDCTTDDNSEAKACKIIGLLNELNIEGLGQIASYSKELLEYRKRENDTR